jgi:hypothetical protein
MSSNSTGNYERDKAVERDAAARMVDPCNSLEEEIEALEERIGVLEEGLPQAPGMERAALFKEVSAYRRDLDARRRALRLCRGTGGAEQHQ